MNVSKRSPLISSTLAELAHKVLSNSFFWCYLTLIATIVSSVSKDKPKQWPLMSFIREDFVSTRSTPLKHDTCPNLKWHILFLNLCLTPYPLAQASPSSLAGEFHLRRQRLHQRVQEAAGSPPQRQHPGTAPSLFSVGPRGPTRCQTECFCPAGRQSGLHSGHAAVPVSVHPEAMRGRLQRPGHPRLWDPPWWVAARVCARCSNSLLVIVFTSSSTSFSFTSNPFALYCIVKIFGKLRVCSIYPKGPVYVLDIVLHRWMRVCSVLCVSSFFTSINHS